MAINLKTLSPSELESLISTARSQLEHSRSRQIAEVRGKIEALLDSAGLALGDVFPRQVAKGRKGKASVPAKYRNPEDPSQTWSGRGKRPLWLVALLKKRGVTLDSLLIDGAGRASPATARKGAAKSASKATKKAAKKAAKTTRRARKA
ncbi:H-NS histone family protein [Dyella sp. BiH032]|uniref:H-NS histone family protein n=1 Tax=Dyella sp. BiH032 TaxID=3075430 RepID=UPI0028934922|nr:H-NS histone family protein [Dyella sp. BiH032]WNL44175.1 H-NS histone family protein [Dyella sp. BiH032]